MYIYIDVYIYIYIHWIDVSPPDMGGMAPRPPWVGAGAPCSHQTEVKGTRRSLRCQTKATVGSGPAACRCQTKAAGSIPRPSGSRARRRG